MAVSGKMYVNAMKILMGGVPGKTMDWTSDTIKVMLLGAGYSPSNNHTVTSDLENNEIVGNGYVAGGANITSGVRSVVSNVTTGAVYLNVSDQLIIWPNSTILNARYAVIYNDTVKDGDGYGYLIGYIDFGENVSSNDSDFVIGWSRYEVQGPTLYNIFKVSVK